MRVNLSYQLAGTDKLNGARSAAGGVEFFLSPHWRLVEQGSLISYYPTGQPQAGRIMGVDIRAGVKYMLGNIGHKTRQIASAD